MSGQMQKNWTKPVLSGLIGAIAGYLAITGYMELGGGAELAQVNPMRLVLSCVGMVYLAMGLFAGLGTLVPRVGAKLLNVAGSEDLLDQRALLLGREDLLDQRALLLGGSVSSGVIGAALMLLAASGPGGSVPDEMALGSLAFALLFSIAITVLQWRHYDELMRQVSWEGSAFGLALLSPALVAWAALAHLGWTAALDPLGVIALLTSALLIGTLIAAGRRGMLTQG